MIFFLIFMATMVVTGIPTAILFIPWCWLTGNVLPLYKGTRFMLSSSCWMAGVRFHVEGIENIPRDRACIFMANHVSNLDPPALISLIPGRTSAFMKRSLMKLPVLGTGFRQGDFIAVDRYRQPNRRGEECRSCQARTGQGCAHDNLCGRHPLAGRPHVALQKRSVLPGHGFRSAVHPSLHPWHGEHPGKRQPAHPSRHSARHLSSPHRPSRLCHARRIDASGSLSHRLRAAGVDADVECTRQNKSQFFIGTLMIVSLIVFVTILVLSIPSAVIFIPLAAGHRQRETALQGDLPHCQRRLPGGRHSRASRGKRAGPRRSRVHLHG